MESIGTVVAVVGFLVLMGAILLAPIALIVALFGAARHRLRGGRSPFDGLFSGMARANQVRNALEAGLPPARPDPARGRHPRGRTSRRRRR